MQPDDLKGFDDLDSLVGGALDRLPPPRAPRSLLPRVMAAVEAQRISDLVPGRGWRGHSPGRWRRSRS